MGKRSPEQEERIRRSIETWPEHRREMEAMYARFKERWRMEVERRERRRALLRRFLPLRRG